MIDTFFPTKTVNVHDEDKPFLTGEIKKLIDERNKAFESGNVTLFKAFQNLIVSKIRLAKRMFYENKISPDIQSNERLVEKHKRYCWEKKKCYTVAGSRHETSLEQ